MSTVANVTYCHLQPLQPPLTSEIPFNIFDLTRSSQETDSLSPNTNPRLVLAAIPTFNSFPPGEPDYFAFKRLQKGSERRLGGEKRQEASIGVGYIPHRQTLHGP